MVNLPRLCGGFGSGRSSTEVQEEQSESAPIKGFSDTTHRSCVFCSVSVANGFDIVAEDDLFVVFKDHNPSARLHLLVVPKRHVKSVKILTKVDVDMLRQMEQLGHSTLSILEASDTYDCRMGFHIPPFNSVNHLHLHVFSLPFLSWYKKVKYPWRKGTSPHDKGWTWFVEIGQAIRILERGARISIIPC
ncbi:HIT-like protein [Stereum hirsutum FP-91666 SS1]|uniref:HIT-like protein n=1 Tax=Stereum hirsutum (strain FP-91666) TaxID=721885 RepID=UPI000440ED9E|nr:HIT-like protein [Stereum hirsutum FP-91666 SS1]EIM90893.1 HIT-like protein [Stereum hirsutum FP-91666 SS1]